MSAPLSQSREVVATGSCANCGAAVAEDQRYCLACGRPCTPLPRPFLDVLQAEYRPASPNTTQLLPSAGALPPGAALPPATVAFALPPEPEGSIARLRRYSPLMGLLALLLATGFVGLVVGHWASGSSSVPPVIKVEYPAGVPGASASEASDASAAPGSGQKASSGEAAGGKESEAEEEKEVKEAETSQKALPPPVKASSGTIKHLSSTHGKKHREEINKLIKGGEPIETG